MAADADVIIVGGGLAGGLLALRLRTARPDVSVLLIERESTLGGNHTWSFHESDLTGGQSQRTASKSGERESPMAWIQPLISKSWTSHSVHFPRRERVLERPYHAIRSERFHEVLMDRMSSQIWLNTKVQSLTDFNVSVERNGETHQLSAPLVIDARGLRAEDFRPREGEAQPGFSGAVCAWQKFIGFDIRLKAPHGLERPILKDACVPQIDGYRFFYCLPWDEKRLLVEETYYSDSPDLNWPRIEKSIVAYVERRGWQIDEIERKEHGSLPLPLTQPEVDKIDPLLLELSNENFDDFSPIRISTGSGWFHSVTGYSFPDAIRTAEFISKIPELRSGRVRAELRRERKTWADRQTFYRMLNRFLFKAAEPCLRYQVLEHFYGLPEEVIERFYAGTTSASDRMRILGGKPPVRVSRALKQWSEARGESMGSLA